MPVFGCLAESEGFGQDRKVPKADACLSTALPDDMTTHGAGHEDPSIGSWAEDARLGGEG